MLRWATPIYASVKKDGTIRLCGDSKLTIISMLQVDQHPLPYPNEIMASLTNGKSFSKLDLSATYHRCFLMKSLHLVTLNTHKGMYKCTSLPFDFASASAFLQQVMDSILQGFTYVDCSIDDILHGYRDIGS